MRTKKNLGSNPIKLDITQGKNIKAMDLKIERLKNDLIRLFIRWVSNDIVNKDDSSHIYNESFHGKIIVNPKKWHKVTIGYTDKGIHFTQTKYNKAWDKVKENKKQRKENRITHPGKKTNQDD